MPVGTVVGPSAIQFCQQCGKPLRLNAKFCQGCGASIAAVSIRGNKPGSTDISVGGSAQSDIAVLEHLVAEHPDDASYRKLLAVQLHDEAIKNWWEDPDDTTKLLCTSFVQIQHARQQLTRALALQLNDPELRNQLVSTLQLANSQERREYTGNWFMIVLLGFFYIVPGWLWWYVNRRPRYLINRDYVAYRKSGRHPGAAAKMGGVLGKVGDWCEENGGEWGVLLSLVATCSVGVILSPIFMILAYKRNYLDVNRPSA